MTDDRRTVRSGVPAQRGLGSRRILVTARPAGPAPDSDIRGEGANVAFSYRYRDASNYKVGDTLVLAGPTEIGDLALIRSRLDDGEYFIAEQVGVAALQDGLRVYDSGNVDDENGRNPDDHPWHELTDVERTDETPSTTMTWRELVDAFEQATNWDTSLSAYDI